MANSYAYVKTSIARRVEWAKSLKHDRPCDDCGDIRTPEEMDWHHRDPHTKVERIAQGIYRMSRERILAEIAKCDLLCQDCHRIRHRST